MKFNSDGTFEFDSILIGYFCNRFSIKSFIYFPFTEYRNEVFKNINVNVVLIKISEIDRRVNLRKKPKCFLTYLRFKYKINTIVEYLAKQRTRIAQFLHE